ncbi:MAG: ABC transporter ATP-binding protein [Sneathiella sp.]|nr:ABC transporter ATP-binding protein [Sneathiella sp.]
MLIADEPTSALDVSVQVEFLNLLTDLQTDHNLTYLMVSHDLPVVAHMCDRVAVMQFGEIVEVMTIEEMREMQPKHAYTRHLLQSSLGYRRK